MSLRKTFSALMVLSVAIAAASAADFSGGWIINKDKSDYRIGFEEKPDLELTVTQTSDGLEVLEKVGGSRLRKMTYKTDGQPQESTNVVGRKVITHSQWEDGKLVVKGTVYANRGGSQTTFATEERWELSADGKVLTIDEKRETPGGQNTSKKVFDKR
jgi:hypothetical protein